MFEIFMLLGTFAGITAVIAIPLAVGIGLPLMGWLARSWLRLKERELAIKEHEFVLRLRESRSIPAWVDEGDPKSLLAWARTDRELTALELGRRGA